MRTPRRRPSLSIPEGANVKAGNVDVVVALRDNATPSDIAVAAMQESFTGNSLAAVPKDDADLRPVVTRWPMSCPEEQHLSSAAS